MHFSFPFISFPFHLSRSATGTGWVKEEAHISIHLDASGVGASDLKTIYLLDLTMAKAMV